MNKKFIFPTILLIPLFMISCGKDSGSSAPPLTAPRYRVLLTDTQTGEVSGTAVFSEKEEETFDGRVHLKSRRTGDRIIVSSTSPCPGPDGSYDVLFEMDDRETELGPATGRALRGGQTLIVESGPGPSACGPLVPIPLE